MERFYCSLCDKIITTSFRSRHIKSLIRLNLSHSVVNRYNLDSNKVEDTNKIIDEHINDYKKKFVGFKFSCKISTIKNRDYPNTSLLKNKISNHLIQSTCKSLSIIS